MSKINKPLPLAFLYDCTHTLTHTPKILHTVVAGDVAIVAAGWRA